MSEHFYLQDSQHLLPVGERDKNSKDHPENIISIAMMVPINHTDEAGQLQSTIPPSTRETMALKNLQALPS